MSRRDSIHDAVRNAIEKEGWLVTSDPLRIPIDNGLSILEVDLGAEKVIAAEKGVEQIAVEIKSFEKVSVLNDFHTALGQYLNYRRALTDIASPRVLYLAVSSEAFSKLKAIPFIQRAIQDFEIKIIVVQINKERIVQWNPS